jgi:hypothetical protein
MPSVKSICDVLVTTEFNIVACMAIFACAIAWGAMLLVSVLRTRRGVFALADTVKQPGDWPTRLERCRAELVAQTSPLLGYWDSWSRGIVELADEDGQVVDRRAARSAGSVFDPSVILAPLLRPRFFASVPNLLTGLGILGTFVGLTAGIYLAQGALTETTDHAKIISGLENLLSGASLAFLTSIVGLVGSIIFTIASRMWLHTTRAAIHGLSAILDGEFRVLSAEDLGARQLHELRLQTAQLQRFNADLAVSIASALDDRLSGRLSPALVQIVTALEGLRIDRALAEEEMVSNVAGKFHESLSGATSAHFSELSATLTELGTTLRDTRDSLHITRGHMVGASQQAADAFKQAMSSSSSAMQTAMADAVSRMVERMDGAAQSLSQAMAAGAGGAAQRLELAMGTTKELVEQIASRLTATHSELDERTRDAMGELVSGLAATSSEIQRELVRATTQVDQHLRDGAAHLAQVLAAAGSGAAESMQGSLASLERTVASFSQSVTSAEQLVGGMRQALTGTTALVEGLDANVASLGRAATALGTFGTTLSKSTSQVDSAADSMAAAVTQVRGVIGELGASNEFMRKAWSDYLERFGAVDQSLAAVFTQIEGALTRYTTRVKEFTDGVDQHLSAALNHMGGIAEELSGAVEELHNAIEKTPASPTGQLAPPRRA